MTPELEISFRVAGDRVAISARLTIPRTGGMVDILTLFGDQETQISIPEFRELANLAEPTAIPASGRLCFPMPAGSPRYIV